MDGSISFAVAFAAGVISFLSPCVLPIVPGYLGFITGMSLDELRERRPAVQCSCQHCSSSPASA
jgi:cytochrome c-type biogenesis protein